MVNPPGYSGKFQTHDHQVTLDETSSITKQNKTKQNHGCGKVQGGERSMRVGDRKQRMKMRPVTMHHIQGRSCQRIDLINKTE